MSNPRNDAVLRYAELEKQYRLRNLDIVREDAQTLKDFIVAGTPIPSTGSHGTPKGKAAWLNTKIVNKFVKWGSLYGDTVEQVCDNIITDTVGTMCSIFAKDPTKQNLSEEIHMSILKENGIPAHDLDNKGPNQVTFINGDKVLGPIPTAEREYGMNCDFLISNESSAEIYTTNKITKGRGGLQENQVGCVRHWLYEVVDYIKKNPDENTRFAAIVDGSTFTMANNRHLNDLIAVTEGFEDRIFVGSMQQFVEGDFIKG